MCIYRVEPTVEFDRALAMISPSECLLKANNYEMAAKMAPSEDRMMYLKQASHWRQLAHELQMERFGPCGSANAMMGEAGKKDTGPLAD